MKTTIIILSVTVYLLMAIISYKPFVKLKQKKYLDHNMIFAASVWVVLWVVLILLAIYEGFENMFKQENNQPSV